MESRLSDFYNFCRLTGIKESTMKTFIIYARQYLTWLSEKNFDEKAVRKTDVLNYRNDLIQTGKYCNATINHKLTVVKLYYKYLMSKGEVLNNPVSKDTGLKERRKLIKNILDIESMGRFLSGIALVTPFDYLFKSICEVLYSSGLRISECLALKETDIDVKGYLRIHDIKGNKERSVPVGDTAMKWIFQYIEKGRLFIVTDNELSQGYLYPQNQYFDDTINDRLAKECRERKFVKLTTHSFRHCCATHLLKKGANIKEVQEFLGHSKVETTSVYTHIMKDDLKKAVKTYHPRGE